MKISNEKLEIAMANECLCCKNPSCIKGCPLQMEIPKFIQYIKQGKESAAKEIIMQKSYLGSICGRVCPHDKQCESACIKSIKGKAVPIGELEAYISDKDFPIKKIIDKDIKVAIIGSGPAGLTCAVKLREQGILVTIFEKEEKLGGVLTYEIPEYRLPKTIVKKTISKILSLGIEVKTNMCLGVDFTLEDLFHENFDAIFLGIGTECAKTLEIPGINLIGVWKANEFLRNPQITNGEKVIVIGGGNVAMDVAEVSKRRGADVTVIYRKKRENMSANKSEIEEAFKNNINFLFEEVVLKMVGNEKVEAVMLASGKKILADKVIIAIGSLPNYKYIENLEKTEDGLVKIDENGQTSIPKVFAGGDLVEKKATVCMAIKTGNLAAESIIKNLARGDY